MPTRFSPAREAAAKRMKRDPGPVWKPVPGHYADTMPTLCRLSFRTRLGPVVEIDSGYVRRRSRPLAPEQGCQITDRFRRLLQVQAEPDFRCLDPVHRLRVDGGLGQPVGSGIRSKVGAAAAGAFFDFDARFPLEESTIANRELPRLPSIGLSIGLTVTNGFPAKPRELGKRLFCLVPPPVSGRRAGLTDVVRCVTIALKQQAGQEHG